MDRPRRGGGGRDAPSAVPVRPLRVSEEHLVDGVRVWSRPAARSEAERVVRGVDRPERAAADGAAPAPDPGPEGDERADGGTSQ